MWGLDTGQQFRDVAEDDEVSIRWCCVAEGDNVRAGGGSGAGESHLGVGLDGADEVESGADTERLADLQFGGEVGTGAEDDSASGLSGDGSGDLCAGWWRVIEGYFGESAVVIECGDVAAGDVVDGIDDLHTGADDSSEDSIFAFIEEGVVDDVDEPLAGTAVDVSTSESHGDGSAEVGVCRVKFVGDGWIGGDAGDDAVGDGESAALDDKVVDISVDDEVLPGVGAFVAAEVGNGYGGVGIEQFGVEGA